MATPMVLPGGEFAGNKRSSLAFQRPPDEQSDDVTDAFGVVHAVLWPLWSGQPQRLSVLLDAVGNPTTAVATFDSDVSEPLLVWNASLRYALDLRYSVRNRRPRA